MKKEVLNKRKIASIGVLGAIATIGIFAGTYAKYVSELPLTGGADQSARVAVWNVGQKTFSINLFDKYYYGASGDGANSSLADSGHGELSADHDTVFQNGTVESSNIHNVVAPGTHGYKTIRITDAAIEGNGKTEVTYTLSAVAGEGASATVTPEASVTAFKSQLKFAVVTDAKVEETGTTIINWAEQKYPKVNGENTTDTSIDWKDVDTALGGIVTNLGNIKGIKDIVVLWKWEFENSTTESNDEKDTALAVTSPTIPQISISFGKIKAEQVD
ncbi:MAG: hypothetical protein LBS33_05945 [Streptococcaceae bacterium]|nr:hypothetical protein [Streptococcaceae bacterium]